jgi:hypothetical protein
MRPWTRPKNLSKITTRGKASNVNPFGRSLIEGAIISSTNPFMQQDISSTHVLGIP